MCNINMVGGWFHQYDAVDSGGFVVCRVRSGVCESHANHQQKIRYLFPTCSTLVEPSSFNGSGRVQLLALLLPSTFS
jgi:hypothetical protein